ncbi:MAG TPA: SpoIIE family protein phosphatase, partial [Acidimicrobiales bacterium]
ALTLAGRDAHIAHVGDSRAYLVRRRVVTQLTADHSRVGEMLRLRLITPEQAANHPARSALTRSLGGDMIVQVDLVTQPVEPGDAFVLCSDGLWDTVPRSELAEILAAIGSPDVPTPAAAAAALVDAAISQKAPDNVTAVVVKVTSDRPIPAAGGRRSLFRRGGR